MIITVVVETILDYFLEHSLSIKFFQAHSQSLHPWINSPNAGWTKTWNLKKENGQEA